jgi:hypothetical protein
MPHAVSRKTWLLLAPAALLLGVVAFRAAALAAASAPPATPVVGAAPTAASVAAGVSTQDRPQRTSVWPVQAMAPGARRTALERSPDL